ncbi:MAG TPA: hypothetical protein DDZ51_20695 [Planctomycetaceae bacterium]|nr:hypothetical protein [Planctomycetaceae bacterium]
MHCIELARIATFIAAQGASLAIVRPSIPASAITQYWVASRQRTELWNRGLARLVEMEATGRPLAIDGWWFEHVPMIEEILVSETLSRVMAAVGAVLDDGIEDREIEPVTHSVFQTHLESRNRVLRILLFSRGRSVEQALRLNRLRRCVERWTDLLIAPLVRLRPDSVQFAIDAGRARAYASECSDDDRNRGSDGSDWLSAATLELSLGGLCDRRAALPQANQQIGESVLAYLRPELFDSLGVPYSTTTQRIVSGHSPECPPAGDNKRGNRGGKHLLFHAPQTRPAAPNLVRWTF